MHGASCGARWRRRTSWSAARACQRVGGREQAPCAAHRTDQTRWLPIERAHDDFPGDAARMNEFPAADIDADVRYALVVSEGEQVPGLELRRLDGRADARLQVRGPRRRHGHR